MPSVSFKLKILTPMFMGGANPDGQPELRAASIRGAMRFWFRAIAGAVTDKPQEVYKLESEVFGNTERKSRVVVRVIEQPRKLIRKGTDVPWRLAINPATLEKMEKDRDKKKKLEKLIGEYGPPVFESKIQNAHMLNFLAYLANMGLAEYRKGFVWSRSGFDVGTIFKVKFSGINQEFIDLAKDIFQIAAILGGFGARWRHGFGSCEIQSGPKTSWRIALENVKKWILERVEAVEELPEVKENEMPQFPSFRKGSYQIWEGRLNVNFSDWRKILTYIGLKYREFRIKEGGYTGFGYTQDYVTLVNADGLSEEDLLNDVFGLPIQFGKRNIVEVSDRKRPEIGRRASPLILHIEPHQKLIRATLFKSKIVPDWDTTKHYARFGKKIDLVPPTMDDFKRIEEFVQSLFENSRRLTNVK